MLKRFFILLSVLLLAGTLQAQVRELPTLNKGNLGARKSLNSSSTSSNSNSPFDNNNNTHEDDSTSQMPQGIVYEEDTPDSVSQQMVFLFHCRPLEVKIMEVWNPSLDPTGAQFHDALDALNGNYYLGRGNIGQNHYALYPTLSHGNALAPTYLEGYARTFDNVDYYQTFTPFTQLGYHSSLNEDYQVRVTHSQNIMPRWNIAFDADLVRSAGVYTNSSVKDNLIDFTTNYYSADSRYQIYAAVISQRFSLGENFGLTNDDLLGSISNRGGIPVVCYDQGSTLRQRGVKVHQCFNTVRQFEWYRPRHGMRTDTIYSDTLPKPDTLAGIDVALDSIVLPDSLRSFTLRTYDTIVGYDTLHPYSPRVLNSGLFALDLEYYGTRRYMADSLVGRQFKGTIYWTNDAYMDQRWNNPFKLRAGLYAEYTKGLWYADTINSLMYFDPVTHLVPAPKALPDGAMFITAPFAHADIALGKNLITLHAQQDLQGQSSEYRAGIYGSLDSLHKHLVSAEIWRQSQPQYLIYQYLTSEKLENTELLGVRLRYRGSNVVDLEATAQHADHLTWLEGEYLMPHQSNAQMWLLQARLTLHLQLGWLHCDMQQFLQHCSDPDDLPLPTFASKNSIYADLHLFHHALHAQIGADVRYHTPFMAEAYAPELGLFYHQHQTQVGNYLWGDMFVNLQIKRATIYAKAGHLNALWEQHPQYFLLPHYPGGKFGFFYGITWKFFD